MNGTPRLGSSYPSTPDSVKRNPTSTGTPISGTAVSKKEPSSAPQSAMSPRVTNAPLIPLNLVDAPSQRLYVFAIYVALLGWRLYDWGKLVEDEADSLWLFIKWVATDAVVFLYALPALRIPWLEWSNPAIMSVFLVHAVLNGMLMFRIPVRHDLRRRVGYTNIEATDPS
jgi:nucleoporin POM152